MKPDETPNNKHSCWMLIELGFDLQFSVSAETKVFFFSLSDILLYYIAKCHYWQVFG